MLAESAEAGHWLYE
ncbi:hypothetical protein ACOJCI_003596 [Cronobacter turicensis]